MATTTQKREEEQEVLTLSKVHIITIRWERKRIQRLMVLTLAVIAQRPHQMQADKLGTTRFLRQEKKPCWSYPKYKIKIKALTAEAIIPSLPVTITKLLLFWYTLAQKRALTRVLAKSKSTWAETKETRKVLANTVLKRSSRSSSSNRRGSRDKFLSMTTFKSTFLQVAMTIQGITQAALVPTCKARMRAISRTQGSSISS